jgi:hypothetical protein
LKPLSKDSKETNGTNEHAAETGADSDVVDVGNLFEYLDIEEPTEWTSSALSPKAVKAISTYELELTDEDISFAIFCLLKDLTDIRHYVRQTVSESLTPFSPSCFSTYWMRFTDGSAYSGPNIESTR